VADIHHIIDTLRAKLPHAEAVIFQGAGHLPAMEQPARFTTTVLDFLGTRRKRYSQ
jgi:pimeloyl-ACP methyl ester carboxylesterase